VAQIAAAANTQIVDWHVDAIQASAANTQMKIIITYADSSTISDTSATASNSIMWADRGGIMRTVVGTTIVNTAGSNLAVTTVRVETAGTGTGIRAATMSGLQVPR